MNKKAKLLALSLSFMLMSFTCACTSGEKADKHLVDSNGKKAQVATADVEDSGEENDYEDYEQDEEEGSVDSSDSFDNSREQQARSNYAKDNYLHSSPKRTQSASLAPRGFGQYQIYDQQANMPVVTLQVPRGWQASSQVKWGQFGYSLCIYEALFTDPSSGVGVGYCSGVTSARQHGIQSSELLNNPKKYGQLFANDIKKYAHMNQNVKLTSAELVSGSAEANQLAAQLKNQGGNCLARTFVAKYDFQRNNQPWVAMLTADVILQEISFAYGPTNHNEWVLNLVSYIYPKNNAESVIKIGKQIIASAVVNQQWQQYLASVTNGTVSQHNNQFQQQQQAVRQNQQDISDMLSDSYQQRSASQDRISQGWSEAIRGESSHANPYDSSSTVTTSNNYNHGWANSNGEVINTGNSNFNPNTSSDYNSSEWTQIK